MSDNKTQANTWLGFFAGALFAIAGILRIVSASRKGGSMTAGFVLIGVGLFWAVLAAGWKSKASRSE